MFLTESQEGFKNSCLKHPRIDQIQNTKERKQLEWNLKEKERTDKKKEKEKDDGSTSPDLDKPEFELLLVYSGSNYQ